MRAFIFLMVFSGLVYSGSAQTSKSKTVDSFAPTDENIFTDSIELVFVAGGSFDFECYGRQPKPFKARVNSFYLSKYEVTQAQWKEVMHYNHSRSKRCHNCPVEYVSWYEVQEFITTLNKLSGKKYRLPTEAEWEFAAKGGILTSHFLYSGSNNIDDVAWYKNNSDGQTHPVGRKRPNELGIYDMTGNVEEWCQDWDGFLEMAVIDKNNPQGPSMGQDKIYRGGSFLNDLSGNTTDLKFNENGRAEPEILQYEALGFRRVRDPR